MRKIKIWSSLLLVIGLSSPNILFAASCEYNILNEWNSGFTAQVKITNNSSEPIDGGSVSWSYTDGSTIPQAWDAQLSGAAPYVASNYSYNANIPPNGSTTFGFNGNKASQGGDAQIPVLGGICSPLPVNQPPVAVISAVPAQGNVPLTVTFNANGSSDLENANLSYRWDFGNGDISTDAIVTRDFTQVGTYPVSLTVNDGQLDSAEVVTTVVATAQPVESPLYTLDSANSSLYFVSSKKTHVLENHFFTDLSGSISDLGNASLSINLSSAETGIAVRNQRLRDLLFEVGTFSEAVASLPVDLVSLNAQAIGTTRTENISATLDLHGVVAAIDTEVAVTKLSDTKILVRNTSPILISAGDYNLTAGVDALRNIANLDVISYTVPVNFTLLFNTTPAQ